MYIYIFYNEGYLKTCQDLNFTRIKVQMGLSYNGFALDIVCCGLVLSGVRVTRSLVLCVCFVDCCLSFRPPKIGKNTIIWRKIVIFHTKYPKIFRASLRNWKKTLPF